MNNPIPELYRALCDLADARGVLRVRVKTEVFAIHTYRFKENLDVGVFVRRFKALKQDLLRILRAGEWKDADQVLCWPDGVFEQYVEAMQAAGWSIRSGLVPPPSHSAYRIYAEEFGPFYNVLLISDY